MMMTFWIGTGSIASSRSFREKCALTFAKYLACTTLKRRLEA